MACAFAKTSNTTHRWRSSVRSRENLKTLSNNYMRQKTKIIGMKLFHERHSANEILKNVQVLTKKSALQRKIERTHSIT